MADSSRIRALLDKDLADLWLNPALFIPASLTAFFSILLPFIVAIVIPAFVGERLSDSSDFEIAVSSYRNQPSVSGLNSEGAIQAWIFQHFLVLLVLTPVAGSMSIAAHSVIGEKQARTLEPLLATPVTTVELVAAKTLGALLPATALSTLGFLVYIGLIAWLAEPGVAAVVAGPRSLALIFVLGPLAGLAALLLAVAASSRVNDARSAQQVGVLVILPVIGLFVVQLRGDLALTGSAVLAIAAVLAVVDVVLLAIAVAVFQRESILTRWK
jgi:ABC-2 type transport system permease protein